MSTLEEIRASGTLRVLPWHDPVVDALGHDPRSFYVERFWLPVLGPSTVFMLRLVAVALEASPGGCELDLAEAARRLGLGERAGRRAPVVRTLARCVDFEMARPAGFSTLSVRRRLPPLARRHLARLTESLLEEHASWTAAGVGAGEVAPGRADAGNSPDGPVGPQASARDGTARDESGRAIVPGAPPVTVLRERGRQLALSLLQLGEDPAAAEHQLVRWHYHPALAGECAAWAAAVHQSRGTPAERGATA